MKINLKWILLTLALALLVGCGKTDSVPVQQEQPAEAQTEQVQPPAPSDEELQQQALQQAQQAEEDVRQSKAEEPEEEPEEEPAVPETPPRLVCIDPGHQSHGNSDKEPNGPGSSTMKAKVTGGARGVSTGKYEYALNLEVSLKLRDELESRGYEVVMVRTENDVDISNVERSQVANEAGADAFIRIHANGSENSSANGAMTICMTSSNPYNSELYQSSRALSDAVLDALVEATGCKRERVWETDTMTGINWCQVPVTIVEMGYLSNPEEDERMSTESYQQDIVTGIANGIDNYFQSLPQDADGEASGTRS